MESPLRRPIPDGTCLIETFGFWPDRGVPHLGLHLARLARGAADLGFGFDTSAIDRALAGLTGGPLRCRLTLGVDGVGLTTAPLPPRAKIWRVSVAPDRLASDDPWLRLKSTQRGLYDRARVMLPPDVDEWLFLNERAEVCEGTITNLFADMPDGRRLTPALACGVLPGILRQRLLATGWQEAVLTLDDLAAARQVYMGNALRGLIPAQVEFL